MEVLSMVNDIIKEELTLKWLDMQRKILTKCTDSEDMYVRADHFYRQAREFDRRTCSKAFWIIEKALHNGTRRGICARWDFRINHATQELVDNVTNKVGENFMGYDTMRCPMYGLVFHGFLILDSPGTSADALSILGETALVERSDLPLFEQYLTMYTDFVGEIGKVSDIMEKIKVY